MTGRAAVLAALAALAAGFSPLEADEEHVSRGNARLRGGDPAGALRSYDDAERAVGSHPEIDHDRGNAALAAGRTDEAKAAWRRAAERAPPALASRALQNLGTALAREGDREGAVRAFTDALTKDPGNEDARWDLEVLLREAGGGSPPPEPSGARAPAPREGPPQGGERQEPRGEEPARRGGGAAEGPADGREPREGPAQREGAPRREPLSRQEAEALLDALRARERQAPFPARERRGGRRPDAAKDW